MGGWRASNSHAIPFECGLVGNAGMQTDRGGVTGWVGCCLFRQCTVSPDVVGEVLSRGGILFDELLAVCQMTKASVAKVS